jgi:lysophospholipase L1-like esterase
MKLVALLPLLSVSVAAAAPPRLDLAHEFHRQFVVDRQPGVYLGHPSTVPLGANSLLAAYPEGHGKGAIRLARSDDGGQTWTRLPAPASFATSLETPTLYRVADPLANSLRIVLFSGLHPIRAAASDDLGTTFSELAPIGDFGGVVAMSSVLPVGDEGFDAYFHDDGRFLTATPGPAGRFRIYATRSTDGGRSFAAPRVVLEHPGMALCEPFALRSQDGRRVALLLRENSRQHGAQIAFSEDGGATYSEPGPLPPWLDGDRHVAHLDEEGRLVVVFRALPKSGVDEPFRGDPCAWIGSFEDLETGGDGQLLVRLFDSHHPWDAGYAGLEYLADRRFVATTYGHFVRGEAPFVQCVRFRIAELLAEAEGPSTVTPPVSRPDDWWQERFTAQLSNAKTGPRTVLLIGDSITQGFETAGKAAFESALAPLGAINLGISGDRTQHVLWRLRHGLLDALKSEDRGEGEVPRVAIVMIGTNNSNGDDHAAAEIGSGVAAIVDELRAALPTTKVLLLGIFPRNADADDAQRRKIALVNDLLSRLDDGENVFFRDLSHAFLERDGTLTREVMPDLLHLSEEGYARWVAAMAPSLDALLRDE